MGHLGQDGNPNTRRLSDTPSRLSCMAISERTRKILWGKAGGRCSVCRVQVVGDPADADDASVFGEEAHIVARSPDGPRGRKYAGDINGYDNLILLCSRHHKEIDDQVNTYTEDQLHAIKSQHEQWIAELGENREPGPMHLVPDPKYATPKKLKLFTSGTAFWHEFDGCVSFAASWIEGLSDEHEDLIAAFLEDLEDWMNIAGGIGVPYGQKRDASKAMNDHISELAKAGFLLGARKRHLLLTDNSGLPPTPFLRMDIEIQPANIALAEATEKLVKEHAANAALWQHVD